MKMMKPSGDTDMDFAMMMKMHHEQALEMAKAEKSNGAVVVTETQPVK